MNTITFHFAGDEKVSFDLHEKTREQLIRIVQHHESEYLEVPGDFEGDTHLINMALVQRVKIRNND